MNTSSSANTDPQLLSEEGGIKLRDFNPKAVLRFTGRKCITCSQEILDHWLISDKDPDLQGEYWCTKDGRQYSMGITDCVYEMNDIQVPTEDNIPQQG